MISESALKIGNGDDTTLRPLVFAVGVSICIPDKSAPKAYIMDVGLDII